MSAGCTIPVGSSPTRLLSCPTSSSTGTVNGVPEVREPRDVEAEGLKFEDDGRVVIWFDIDNCLYTKHAKVNELMGEKIRAYFVKLGLGEERARELHAKYYKEYVRSCLAIRGLARHHQVDPLDYDKHCDAALPLESVLKSDPKLRRLLKSIDRRKARVWALTNAYKVHAHRVLNILGVADQFDAVVSCDYAKPNFACKPEPEFFQSAVAYTEVPDKSRHYFVDDSLLNVKGAKAFGWDNVIWFDEGRQNGKDEKGEVIGDLEELRSIWKEFFLPPDQQE